MKNFQVGIIGATGMVGQRFATLLENHPWSVSYTHLDVYKRQPLSMLPMTRPKL